MSLQHKRYLNRSVLPHGSTGSALTIPAEVRDDLDLAPGDAVDLEYDREKGTLTVHLE